MATRRCDRRGWHLTFAIRIYVNPALDDRVGMESSGAKCRVGVCRSYIHAVMDEEVSTNGRWILGWKKRALSRSRGIGRRRARRRAGRRRDDETPFAQMSTKRQRVAHRVGVLSSVCLSRIAHALSRINKFIYAFFPSCYRLRDRYDVRIIAIRVVSSFTSPNVVSCLITLLGRSYLLNVKSVIHVSFPGHIYPSSGPPFFLSRMITYVFSLLILNICKGGFQTSDNIELIIFYKISIYIYI